MNDDEKQFADFVSDIRFDDTPLPGHREKLEQNLLQLLAKQTPRQTNLWRTIMKNQITKYAAAAVIIAIAAVGIIITDKLATPAWAIEQSIDALRKFNAIHFSGTMLDEHGSETSFEAWVRADSKQATADSLRSETGTGQIDVVWQHRRYEYDPRKQIVYLTENYGPVMSPWPGAGMLEAYKKLAKDWHESYGKDSSTGRACVFVTGSFSPPAAPEPRSLWIQFDVESKLPVSFKQWENLTREGPPRYYVQSITYLENLPDNVFEFKIPEGAQIIEKRPGRDASGK